MLKSHDRFFAVDGKRLVLVVDDEEINREMLGFMLSENYNVLFAENGKEALEIIREHVGVLSLVLLDLMMPEMDGFAVMEVMKQDPELKKIPYIVLTSEKAAEVRSLRAGAADFITKPFDQPEVILARIQKTIELSEDNNLIQITERDNLTGLFNREYFYQYAEQLDLHHPDRTMDAVSVDINHFHLINELYGWEYGDSVLKEIGARIRQVVGEAGGVAGRMDADMFLLYFPHSDDYTQLLEDFQKGLMKDKSKARIRMRMGVYPEVDKSTKIERRFDRAKLASDNIRNSYTSFIAYYDDKLREKELLSERLINDLERAIEERQFIVFYQPKYGITGDTPRLGSAEALIRWKHPELGMISPGIFIPLFEEKGLIQKVDRYVWKEAAEQVRRWKEKYGLTVPVSVNVSRVDIYAPDFVENFLNLMQENGLDPKSYYLEITESAYTEDAAQLLDMIRALRSAGFLVEMDDFGSGYSSLNMLSTLPIDILKLDMSFIRNMRSNQEKDIRILELMIDIARYLHVPVVAEGVETEEQMNQLKKLGCDMIQGYYFSKPVPAEEFEQFIREELEHNADN